MNARPSRALQREWQRKLAESGFVDIEKDGMLNVWENLKWNGVDRTRLVARQRYYVAAEHFMSEWADLFMTEIEAHIWALHSEGLGCRAIMAELSKTGFKTNKDYINYVVRDLKELMFQVMDFE